MSSANKNSRDRISSDISATRLSQRDPLGFPPHPHGRFSIIVYLLLAQFNIAAADHSKDILKKATYLF